jgi:hypothetical protein
MFSSSIAMYVHAKLYALLSLSYGRSENAISWARKRSEPKEREHVKNDVVMGSMQIWSHRAGRG